MAQQANPYERVTLKHEFSVPDFYKDFTCKGGDCRNTCCSGWKVTIARQQYFVLHGLDCEASLRDKLDRTFRPLPNPTPERYAEIVHNYEGNCPLLMKNGYCELHSSCGEKVLPWVCRYYPRGPRIDYDFEVTVANSCEKTLELLFKNNNPISFEKRVLTFKMQVNDEKPNIEDKKIYQEVSQFCFKLLGDRTVSLPQRIRKIGNVLKTLDIDVNTPLEEIDLTVDSVEFDHEHLLGILLNISDWFIENRPSLTDYCSKIKELYLDSGNQLIIYEQAKKHFESVIPDHEIKFEKMLINNLFFRQFPYFESTKNFTETYISLVGTYVFIRYIGINLMLEKNSIEDFIDIMAKTFRVITHTRFESNIISLLGRERSLDNLVIAMLLNL